MSSSTPAISSEVAELKDMVRALLLDKKTQSSALTSSSTPASVKAVEPNCVTCGGTHSYQNCPATSENVYRDSIQEYVSQAAVANYNQGNTSFRPQMVANQIRPLGFPPHQNNQNNFSRGNNFNQNRGGNFNQSNFNQGSNFNQCQLHRPQVNQPLAYQAHIPQTQRVSQTDFESYVKANDAILRNMQSQGQNTQNQCQNIQNQYQNLQIQMANLSDMMSKFVSSNTASSSGSGLLPLLPSNTITNPKEELKGITTRSGVAYQGPTIPTPSKVVKQGTEPIVAPVSALMPNLKSSIPYPSRRDNERRRDQANKQIEKFYEIFKDISFEISFTDALILMPKFASTLKALIGNKKKLSEMARIPMNEHCLAVILNKLLRKLGDPGKFLIPCEFSGMDECLALADLGASINLMPLSVWEALSLPELTPTYMTLELANHFKPDPRVPLILRRCFLKTSRALIDVHKGELTLRIENEAVTYNLDQTVRYSANYNQMTANKIDVINMACEEYSQEVLGFSDVTASGNPTPHDDPIVSTTSPTLTLFGDSDFLLFEETDAFFDILNSEPLPPLPNHEQYMPSFEKELKGCEAKTVKSSVYEPPDVELKDLPPHIEYAFLEGNNKLPVIIVKELGNDEKSALIKVLKSYKRVIAWKLSDIQGGFTVVENEENELIPTRLVTGWRVCIDYRKLNEASRKDHFPLPFMDQMLERLAGNEFYCFLDGFSMYFQIPIDPRDQDKTTFTAHTAHLPIVACLSVCAMHRARFKGVCWLFFTTWWRRRWKSLWTTSRSLGILSFENCLSHLDKMLQRCEDTNLCLNWEKSHFMVKEGIVLGHKISKNRIGVDRAKVDFIVKLPHPTTVKGVRSFLSHAGFYRRFIQDFFKISRPMTHLLKKNTPFIFFEDCIKAFQTLKKKLTEAPI
nr:reverse transcriptase domain-containing protein [Tanacetum cinerariifolium]